MVFFIVLAVSVFKASGHTMHSFPMPMEAFWPGWIVWACVVAPVSEELVYRAVLVPPIESLLGPKSAITLSGAVFALLHLVAGVAGPNNQLAGFFLAWAFVRSRTVVVPIALHSLGNLAVGLWSLTAFYYPELVHRLLPG